MSYDIRVWSSKPINLSESCIAKEGWLIENSLAHYTKEDWQIVVTDSAAVENEDIPEEAISFNTNIKYLTEIILEPLGAPGAAKVLLDQLTKNIARSSEGVIEDLQQGTFFLSDVSSVKKSDLAKKKKRQRFSLLEMSWWFNETPVEKKVLLQQIINYFEEKLPEALPRRYGLYEPPQYKYLKAGKLKLIEFLDENDMVVWYPTKPVLGIHMSFLKKAGVVEVAGKARFQTNHFSIALDANVLKQAGRNAHLAQVFKDLSKMFKPFYGEVRVLHNYIRGGATYYADSTTQWHPVKGGWWVGIPQNLPQAIVIGEPYLTLWPALKEKSELSEDLCFASLADWEQKSVSSIVGNVPKDIAQLQAPKYLNIFRHLLRLNPLDYSEIYPKNFPFKNVKLG